MNDGYYKRSLIAGALLFSSSLVINFLNSRYHISNAIFILQSQGQNVKQNLQNVCSVKYVSRKEQRF